ncbi:hypothetical protein J1N10_02085 [Carboxylicivirga sp. A043]|uniref:hypothetical protein n=1 Tax=Carboxylicivirga litoralis TaxID=2816963 RepID=UPI0021CB7F6C|nr:hypothetical protein [Carboxylicivirga sp. A043]MCU4154745.1 hypothetical protein [Carboxylicivirga sp. A043]
MKIRIIITVFILVCLPWASAFAQQQVWLHGQVVRESDNAIIPLAQIASFKKMNVFAADSTGEFKVILDGNDSIKVLALGFESRIFHLDSLNVDADLRYQFPLKQISYQVEQVDIHSNVHYNNYMDLLRAQKLKRQEMDLMLPSDIKLGKKPDIPANIRPDYNGPPPILAAVIQPFSFIDYYTSKTDKRKRQYMKLLQKEKQLNLLTNEMMQEVSGLEGEALQNFIIYCNSNIKLNDNETSLSIKYKVIDLFNEYKTKS